MNSVEFAQILNSQLATCESVLNVKGVEYATEDRLHNFKVAAELEGVIPRQALAGMMAKHTVSIYDMCGSTEAFPLDVWSEKITDHINYLILLCAIVQEEFQDSNPTLFTP